MIRNSNNSGENGLSSLPPNDTQPTIAQLPGNPPRQQPSEVGESDNASVPSFFVDSSSVISNSVGKNIEEQYRAEKINAIQTRQRRLERIAASSMPEIHIVGQILSCNGVIHDTSEGAFVRYKIDFSGALQHIGGDLIGQTHVAYSGLSCKDDLSLNHPIDIHLAEMGMQGFGSPRILLQSYRLDSYGQRVLNGYGFHHLPMLTGMHRLCVPLWRPMGSYQEELEAYFVGKVPALITPDPIYDSAWKDRSRMMTTACGQVIVEIFVISRFTASQSIEEC